MAAAKIHRGGVPRSREFIELQMEIEHYLRHVEEVKKVDFVPGLIKIRQRYLASQTQLHDSTLCHHWSKAIRESVDNMDGHKEIAEQLLHLCRKRMHWNNRVKI